MLPVYNRKDLGDALVAQNTEMLKDIEVVHI